MTETDWDDVLGDSPPAPAESNVMPRTGTSRAGTRTRRPAAKKLDTLKANLSKQMFQAGAMLGMGLPVTGYYIASESDNFCDAIVTLAAKKADWIEALEHIADIGPGVTVGRIALGIGCALGTDRYYRTEGQSGISPDKRAAMFLGVSAAYYEVHKEENAPVADSFVPPPHGTFVPVA